MEHVAYLVVGAGPAGLQIGHLLGRAGLEYRVLERASHAGSFFAHFPRHRRLISINKVHTGCSDPETNLRWDWNSLLHDDGPRFGARTDRYFPAADDMVAYLDDFARRNAIAVEYDADVVRITRAGPFVVETSRGTWTADRVIIATGMAADNVPPIPGIELAEGYRTMPVQPAGFRGQRVLILGKGNSAFETADNLVESASAIHLVSPTPVRMAWQTHFVGHLRAVNNNLLDTYQRHFSAFIHGFRYNVEALVRILLERYHDTPWPVREIAGADDLADAMADRMNRCSVLFQQPGFIADVVRVHGDDASYLEAVPLDCFLDAAPERRGALELTLTLEYGEHRHPDPFNIERFPEDGASSSYIHPVVRAYRDGVQSAELHIPEDLENDWSASRYRQLLRGFLDEQRRAEVARSA